MKTVVVTGAGGFIGRRLAARLCEDETLRVVALGRAIEPPGLAVALQTLTPAFWTQHGINAIDTLFHLGGFTPKNAAESNAIGPIVTNIASATAAVLESLPRPPRHVAFTSTLDVYGAAPETAICERSPVAPATLYGAAKLFAEQIVRTYARQTGCGYSILRLGHIFGPGEERYEKALPNLIRAMLHGRIPRLSGDGSTLRDYLYVDDAVAAIAAAAARDASSDPINVVRGESVTILHAAQCIAELTGYDGPFEFSGTNAAPLRFDNTRMQRTLGITSFVSLQDGLAREVAALKL